MHVAVPVAVPVAGLTKRFFNQKDFLINVWGYTAGFHDAGFKYPEDLESARDAAAAMSLEWREAVVLLKKNRKTIFFQFFSDSENQFYIGFCYKSKSKTGKQTVRAMQLKNEKKRIPRKPEKCIPKKTDIKPKKTFKLRQLWI